MQLARGFHIEVQEPGEGKVDLAHFVHVEGVAKAAKPDHVLFIKGLLHLGSEPGPGLPVQLHERGDTFPVRFIALQSHPRDSALHGAESEMDWPVGAGTGLPQPGIRPFAGPAAARYPAVRTVPSHVLPPGNPLGL
ncbi:hypothetical protein NicSoilB8_33130 [Arthrobacter sp. NicSoilB8]|nr:hypothetical protein NicSoilB8_33130 [Arthrobacter sp. NicSoilB8]